LFFSSLSFAFFFLLITCAYFALPHRFRWGLLLAGSYFFYAFAGAKFLFWMIASTLVTYGAGVWMGRSGEGPRRKGVLLLGLAFNIGFLFVFKYIDFFTDTLNMALNSLGVSYRAPGLTLLLPVGISFYTFKNLSYTIDVYRDSLPPEKHLGLFALYVSFFPQVLAGPIERAGRLLPQFREKHSFDYDRVTRGLKLMVWGLFQKMVIADNLAVWVDHVYAHQAEYPGFPLAVATFFFAFQIYCDFAGYSDIAIGAAEILGFKTMENFRRPYLATSISEFWRRWHISLSTWFRDYLYIPLGGSRVAIPRWYLNLLIVFLVCGLWHGASWTFIVWGGIHGLYLIFSLVTRPFREWAWVRAGGNRWPNLKKAFRVWMTFSLVCLAWIFFRANSLSESFSILSRASMAWKGLYNLKVWERPPFGGPLRFEFLVGCVSILLLVFILIVQERLSWTEILSKRPGWVRWPIYYAGVLAILLLGSFGTKQFIYFQF
jgi:alginate O-acetyltransferase complex protein AlgI